jgi:hypothetical protein
MSQRIKGIFDSTFREAVWRMLIASLITGIVTYNAVKLFELTVADQSFAATFPKFAIIAVIGLTTYVILCKFAKLKEADIFVGKLQSILYAQFKGRA